MGVATSRVADLLQQMGWPNPDYAEDFDFTSLQSYLEGTNLEICLPRHAPQCDLSIGDRKPKMYPRPSFCQEGYKMHLALLGPSTAAKRQFTEFIPKIANVFQGPTQKLGPGRDAVPYHFLDPELHRVVLWELPEINFKQSAEDYVRELGLLYIDVVFLLFSDKYLLTDVYCKLVVTMAIHGIPFFVICTQSSDNVTQEDMQRIKMQFQQKDVQGIRIFNPHKPQQFVETLLQDFVKEISWNRGKQSQEGNVTEGMSEAILGQTVRLKNLEKKPELNGRCGVCIGFNKETDRYLARIITDGVEQDISLKESSFSILKPKMLGQVVRVKGLEKKPELNGRFGFVDEFLRESERYRVFLPDVPGRALVLALKGENLEKMESVRGAAPISATQSEAKPSASLPSRPSSDPSPKASSATSPSAKTSPKNSKSFDPPVRDKPPIERSDVSRKSSATSGPVKEKAPVVTEPIVEKNVRTSGGDDGADSLTQLIRSEREKDQTKKPEGDDLMSRIFAAESQDDREEATEKRPQQKVEVQVSPPSRQRLQLSLQGLLGMRVWAVIGDPDESEEIIDHLMDCGKTVFSISIGGEAHFASTLELDNDPSLPKTEVLAFVDPKCADVKAVIDAKRLSLRGVVFHPQASAYSPDILEACRGSGMTVHSADVLCEVQPGGGLLVAPLD